MNFNWYIYSVSWSRSLVESKGCVSPHLDPHTSSVIARHRSHQDSFGFEAYFSRNAVRPRLFLKGSFLFCNFFLPFLFFSTPGYPAFSVRMLLYRYRSVVFTAVFSSRRSFSYSVEVYPHRFLEAFPTVVCTHQDRSVVYLSPLSSGISLAHSESRKASGS